MLQRDDGSFLLAQRPQGKVYAGYWEFPGGKVEPGESAAGALARELHEELGIEVRESYAWLTRDYEYEHASVRLRFRRVTSWSGELHGRENQAFAWQSNGRVTAAPVLPANGPIMRALALPHVYGVSNAATVGRQAFLQALDHALEAGLRLVQLREKDLSRDELSELASSVLHRAKSHGAKLLVNATPALLSRAPVDGIHLSSAELMAIESRPDFELVAASCHDARELEHAARLNLDFVVLGPVTETASHPGTAPLGWSRFEALIRDYPLPVFAIGGLAREDLVRAWQAGAHGIAAIRGAWSSS